MKKEDAEHLYQQIRNEDPEVKIKTEIQPFSPESDRWRICLTHVRHNLKLTLYSAEDWPFIKHMWDAI